MIVPSIDLMTGSAVQLIGGAEKALDAGEPRPIAQRFALAGEVAVVDLDAALGAGDNMRAIRELLSLARCRVGGGIRSAEAALDWLDAGAHKVVLGTAATPNVLRELPRERVVAALDARHGEVITHGWTRGSGVGVVERMRELREHVGGFLVTFIEREGRLAGFDWERVAELAREAGEARLTIAGGARGADDIAKADEMGVDVQVGMALYTGALDLADAIAAPARFGEDGLIPTIVADERGAALGLAWSTRESLRVAVRDQRGVYWSRSRNQLWRKGDTSGALQRLIRVDLDCDRDALRFVVEQAPPGFCHLGARTCFGDDWGLSRLERRLAERLASASIGSFTAKLARDAALLRDKLLEEAGELASASSREDVIWEAADVMYFTLVALGKAGATLADVEGELERRALKVRRRSESEAGDG